MVNVIQYNDINGIDQTLQQLGLTSLINARKLTFRGVADVLQNLRDRLYVTIYDPAQTIPYEAIVNPLLDIKAALIEDYNSLPLDEPENLMPKNIANHAIQFTIQGQTITSIVRHQAHFKHHCSLKRKTAPAPSCPAPPAPWRCG